MAETNEGTEIERRHWIYRHPLTVRITHWINVVCLTALLMSGFQIFNAHPALYWGAKSHFDTPILEMKAVTAEALKSGDAARSAQSLSAPAASSTAPSDDHDDEAEGDAAPSRGVVTLGGRVFDTTGWLGFTSGPDGQLTARGFPSWITLPGTQDLATARRWHFFFAWLLVLNGLVYLAFGFASGRIRSPLRRGFSSGTRIPAGDCLNAGHGLDDKGTPALARDSAQRRPRSGYLRIGSRQQRGPRKRQVSEAHGTFAPRAISWSGLHYLRVIGPHAWRSVVT